MATTISITEIVARFCNDIPTTFLHVGSVYFVYKTFGTLSRSIWPPQKYVWVPKSEWSTPGPDEDIKWLFLEHGYRFLHAASIAVTGVMAIDNFVVGRGPFALKFLEASATVGGTMFACYGVPLLWNVMASRDFWERSLYAYGQAIDRLALPEPVKERSWHAVKRKADRKDKKCSTDDDTEETLAQVINSPEVKAGKMDDAADACEVSLQSSSQTDTAKSDEVCREEQIIQINKELDLAKEDIFRLNNELAQAKQEMSQAEHEKAQAESEAQRLRDEKPLSQQEEEAEQQVARAKREAEDAKVSEARVKRMLAEARSEKHKAETRASQADKRACEAMKEAYAAGNEARQARRDADGAKAEASEARRRAETAGREKEQARREAAEARKDAAQARKEATEAGKKLNSMGQSSQKASKSSPQHEDDDDYVTADSIYRQVWTAE